MPETFRTICIFSCFCAEIQRRFSHISLRSKENLLCQISLLYSFVALLAFFLVVLLFLPAVFSTIGVSVIPQRRIEPVMVAFPPVISLITDEHLRLHERVANRRNFSVAFGYPVPTHLSTNMSANRCHSSEFARLIRS